MNEIASPGQIRMTMVRWMLVCIPAIVGIGSLMGILSGSGNSNGWYALLIKPELQPPGWAFGVVWPILYTMMAVAFAMILSARGAPGRGLAIAVFLIQLVANFAWSPLFFGARQVSAALILLVAILAGAAMTTLLFQRIRPLAALLMLPYLAWLSFACYLNWDTDRLNPDAETLVPPAASANIS
ncbi:MAG: tryptophan-rich sensory protein [Sphingopyxis sp.]|nr:tryptophan-rich sensory protein [Sphingopyxis sp.]